MLPARFHSNASPRWTRLAAVVAIVVVGTLQAWVADAATRTPSPTRTPTPTVTATPKLVRVALAPTTAKRQVGQTQNFTATGYYSDGSTKNLTQKVTYSSSSVKVAVAPNTDGNRGLVQAVGIGTATISAVEPLTGIGSNASNDSAVFQVVEASTPTPTRTGKTPTPTRTPTPTVTATPKLQSLALAPSTAKRNVGQTQNFTCTGTYSDGSQKNLTQQATYSSSDTGVAQTPNAAGNKGQVLAVGTGVATISATFGGISTATSGGNAELTVVVAPTPTPTRTGKTPTPTLSPTPTVTATPILVSIALSPQSAKRGTGSFQNFACVGTLSDGSTKNLTQRCDYASSDPTVASAPNDPTNKGKVLALSVGVAIISAVDPQTGIDTAATNGNATFEVIPAPTPTPTSTNVTPTRTRTPTPTPTSTPRLVSLIVSPATAKRNVGQTQNFTVAGTYSDGSAKNLTQKVDYFSSNPAVAQAPNLAGNKGQVLAVAPGVATISAKDPVTGITSMNDANAIFTVVQAPTPTPTYTGPTSTAPTGTKTFTPAPEPTATPVLTAVTLKPDAAQKFVGAFQNFSATGTFSDGSTKNVTQRLHYDSSDPTVASAPNDPTNRGKVLALKPGVVTITASDAATGVSGTAQLRVVEGSAKTPNPRVTSTPTLPDSTGNPTTACQRDVRRAARAFVDKKLKALERCGSAAARCIQRKPDDPTCLPSVRTRCDGVFAKLAEDEARLVAAVMRRCAALTSTQVLGQDGLSYGDIISSCQTRFGRSVTDLSGVAQCLAAQHACRTEVLFALERPRAGELLDLVSVAPDAEHCRQDFGGNGSGLGDPKGAGKGLERCVKAIVKGGSNFARTRLGAIGRCVDNVFVCVEAPSGTADCLAKSKQKCAREFTRVGAIVAKLGTSVTKGCGALDFGVLSSPVGAYLDAVAPLCASYGIPSIATLADFTACLVQQHACEVADLVRFESPRAEEMLGQVDQTLVDGTCPPP